MRENKFSEIFTKNTSDMKNCDHDSSIQDNRLKRFSDLVLSDNARYLPKFQQNDYCPLFEKGIADLFVNIEENIELNSILSKINKKNAKSGAQKLQERLEINFKNSLHKNLAQRSSIKKFLGLLFNDMIGVIAKKDVS